MRYEFVLARRYAFSKRRENFITVISLLSMLGLTVGTAALIIVLSVFNGFSSVVTQIYVSFDPHVRIEKTIADTTSPANSAVTLSPALTASIASAPHVRYVAPTVHGKAVLVHYTLPRVVELTGISSFDAAHVSGLERSIQSGTLSLDSNSIIVGELLADELAIQLGDTLRIVSPLGLERMLSEPVTPRTSTVVVRAIFTANNRDYDLHNAYTSLTLARSLFGIAPNQATTLDVMTDDLQNANSVKSELSKKLGTSYQVQSWYDLHTELYSVMQIERWVAYIILFLIVAVAAFNIFSSLTLTVFEKRRDIGLLRALGSSAVGIRNIYFFDGLLVGTIGTVLGCAIGLLTVVAQQQFQFFKLDMSVYIIPALPVELRWQDFVAVGLGSLGLTIICSLIPSRRASSVDPAEALRWE